MPSQPHIPSERGDSTLSPTLREEGDTEEQEEEEVGSTLQEGHTILRSSLICLVALVVLTKHQVRTQRGQYKREQMGTRGKGRGGEREGERGVSRESIEGEGRGERGEIVLSSISSHIHCSCWISWRRRDSHYREVTARRVVLAMLEALVARSLSRPIPSYAPMVS